MLFFVLFDEIVFVLLLTIWILDIVESIRAFGHMVKLSTQAILVSKAYGLFGSLEREESREE